MLLPRADIATETLAEGLRERGWEIEDVTAYRTVRAAPPPAETREMIKSGGFDAVCFTSSSTVRNLVGIAGKPHARTIVACIGPKTAETAAEFGLRVDVQPETAAVGPLVDARGQLIARHGLAAFAEYFGPFSAGERNLARVWSTVTDGHSEEARKALVSAKASFEQAAANWEQVEAG